MDFTSIFMAMIQLFLILIVGYSCHKVGLFPEQTQTVLTRVVLYVTTPCTILYSVLGSTHLPDIKTIALILGVSIGCYLLAGLVAAVCTRLLRVKAGVRGVYACMLLFSNCGFVGFPVVQTIFGVDAVFYASVLNMPFHLLVYTLGIFLLQQDRAKLGGQGEKLKLKASLFLNPCILAALAAIVLALTEWRTPAVVTDTIASIGNITTPASLLVIGISIAKQPLKQMLGAPRLYLLTLVRLVALPALIWAILRLFITDTLLLGVATVIFAMPVATVVPMLAQEQGADGTDAVRGVFLSTVLSMVTIPLLVTVLM